jgi:hypothetical protein
MITTVWPSLYRPAEGRAVDYRSVLARVRAPRRCARKEAAPRVALSEYHDGYRDLAHHDRANGIMVDLDTPTTREQIEAAFGEFCGFAYTTWTAGHWRAGILLDRPVTLNDDEFSRVQRAVLAHAERAGLAPEHGQSAAHCYALPVLGGAPYEHAELAGAFFDVADALRRFPKPEPVPQPTRADRDSYDRLLERAAKYLAKMPGAISGSGGHATTFAAARALVRGFALEQDDALRLLLELHNPMCAPPWTEKELKHKVKQAYQRARVPFGAIADRPLERRTA